MQLPEFSAKPDACVVRLTPAVDDEGQEIDQDNKAVAMNGRVAQLPYTVVILNQQAAKVLREDLVNAMVKLIPGFFSEESRNAKKILNKAESFYLEMEQAYIDGKCSAYELPCFEIPTDASLYE